MIPDLSLSSTMPGSFLSPLLVDVIDIVSVDDIAEFKLFVLVNGRAELESREECFDVIIGDLADPIEGGPCYQLYTKSFYESTVKPRLSPGGIFVTQVCNRGRGRE